MTLSGQGKSSFYLFDDNKSAEEVANQNITIAKRKNRDARIYDKKMIDGIGQLRRDSHPNNHHGININTNLGMTSSRINSPPVMTLKDQFKNQSDILKFPVESSHSYSYAHLSPNSLALRLNVLKRSLEILKDRPNLINSRKHDNHAHNLNTVEEFDSSLIDNVMTSSPSNINSNNHNNHTNANNTNNANISANLQSNASSAALAALFRPKVKRSDSLPTQVLYSQKSSSSSLTNETPSSEISNNIFSNDLKDIINLLENNDVNISKTKDFASTLHDLSLTPENDQRYNNIMKRLMHALSIPFVDTSVMTTISENNNNNGSLTPNIHASSVALNLLNNNSSTTNLGNSINNNTISSSMGGNRPFHSISSGKHALPQSVFTIDYESPWQVKAANDLACLMFGVSKNMIKSLTLMDLIAPQFREFVIDRLAKNLDGVSKNQSIPSTDIIFSGEIVAISRPGDKGYAWTSLWAKKKGNLIIFMFDQIPCDAFDIVISKDLQNDSNKDFNVESANEIAGNLFNNNPNPSSNELTELSKISQSINNFLDSITEEVNIQDVDVNNPETMENIKYIQSEKINERRYFTLQLIEGENIPCAVTSNALDIHPHKSELKLKIHSLPYIAGIFVIDAKNFNILSCNNSIARNLFGWSSIDLLDKSINLLIDNFSSIYDLGTSDPEKDYQIVPGLVLPEHFFRKFNAKLNHPYVDENELEDYFIKSKGLTGKHVDGNSFNVDVQLRVSAVDTYVLWITYSRSSSSQSNNNTLNKNPDVDYKSIKASYINDLPMQKEPENDLLRPIFKRARSVSGGDGLSRGFSRLPSQLKLFDDSQEDLPTVGDISRHNSTRNPNIKERLTKLSEPETRESSYSGSTVDTVISSVPTNSTRNSSLKEVEGMSNNKHISIERNTSNDHKFQKASESDLINEENLQINEKSEKSVNWPTEIGAKRRTKTIEEFNVVRNMGEGAYGKVILAQHKNDKPYEVIIKCIDKERILVDTWVRDRKLGTIPSEIQIMSTLMKELHPNIMRIVDFFEDEQYYYLETPIFGAPPAIDLFDYIEVKNDMSEFECKFIFKQVVSAVFHLHKHGIIHRDIKDENVIVDERGIIKLIDFGSAGYTKSGPFDVFVGTIDYASPEVLRGEKYSGKPQDIWALGILLYTILYKENPFYNVDEIMEGDLRLPPVISENAINLIRKILVRNIDERPTITDIMEDNWLQ